MNFSQLHKEYWLIDGTIKSFHLDIHNNTADIELSVKRIANGKLSGLMQERDLIPCTIRLTFEDLIEASIFDKFPTLGYYITFQTYGDIGEEVGISFNVHDSSSYTYEKYNWVIKGKRLTWKEV